MPKKDVNWNSKTAQVGKTIELTAEVMEVTSENGQLVAQVRLVGLPNGANVGQTIVISGTPVDDDDDDDDDDKKDKKK